MALVVFFAHEEQRRMRREQQQGSRGHAGAARNQGSESFPSWTVAYLVVVLQTDHVRRRRHIFRRRSPGVAVPVPGGLALKNETLGQRADNLFRLAKILVVALALPGKERVNRMVEVVTPQSVQA